MKKQTIVMMKEKKEMILEETQRFRHKNHNTRNFNKDPKVHRASTTVYTRLDYWIRLNNKEFREQTGTMATRI